jgi:hypothetical protein
MTRTPSGIKINKVRPLICLKQENSNPHKSLVDGLVVYQPPFFSTNQSQKNAGIIHFMFGGRFSVSQTVAKDNLRSTLADFFIK